PESAVARRSRARLHGPRSARGAAARAPRPGRRLAWIVHEAPEREVGRGLSSGAGGGAPPRAPPARPPPPGGGPRKRGAPPPGARPPPPAATRPGHTYGARA